MSALRKTELYAANSDVLAYPIHPDCIRYKRVPLATVGEFYPHGVTGKWVVDEAYLDALAETYNAFFFAAPLNTDHERFYGPAHGLIEMAYRESKILYGDIAIPDPQLAWEIDHGMWPHRSIQWFDEEICGFKFYDKYSKYLTGLALLGQVPPAVPALGPWPAREQPQAESEPSAPQVYAYPLAAQSGRLRTITFLQEAPPMPIETGTPPPAAQAGAGAQATTAATPTPAELAAENEKLQAENAKLKASGNEHLAASNADLMTQNAALKAENAQLKAAEATRNKDEEIAKVLGELSQEGYVVPANEPATKAALEAAYGNPAAVTAVVDMCKAMGKQVTYGEVAHASHANPNAVQLTAMEKEAAALAGVTEEEFLAAKLGRPMPTAKGGDK